MRSVTDQRTVVRHRTGDCPLWVWLPGNEAPSLGLANSAMKPTKAIKVGRIRWATEDSTKKCVLFAMTLFVKNMLEEIAAGQLRQ